MIVNNEYPNKAFSSYKPKTVQTDYYIKPYNKIYHLKEIKETYSILFQ